MQIPNTAIVPSVIAHTSILTVTVLDTVKQTHPACCVNLATIVTSGAQLCAKSVHMEHTMSMYMIPLLNLRLVMWRLCTLPVVLAKMAFFLIVNIFFVPLIVMITLIQLDKFSF